MATPDDKPTHKRESKTEPPPKPSEKQKNPAAVELGRQGGLKGGRARAAKMTDEERAESARNAANARWNKPKR